MCEFCRNKDRNRKRIENDIVEFSIRGVCKAEGGRGNILCCIDKRFNKGFSMRIYYCPLCGRKLKQQKKNFGNQNGSNAKRRYFINKN